LRAIIFALRSHIASKAPHHEWSASSQRRASP
jgi:hypothetical protein